jgi:hypothetical protein
MVRAERRWEWLHFLPKLRLLLGIDQGMRLYEALSFRRAICTHLLLVLMLPSHQYGIEQQYSRNQQ